jgi:hypothetical protein
MEFMEIKRDIRKIAELGIGAIAIFTLTLAGCGGGGGGSSAVNTNSSPGTGPALVVYPGLGKFTDGATVRVKDKLGNLLDTRLIINGVATLYPNSSAYPLLIEAGINGDTYYDEKLQVLQTITGVSVNSGAIRALVPFSTVSQVGVTTVTEIAAGGLVNSTTGIPNANITPASAVGANATVGQIFGVPDPLLPPTLVSSAAEVNALTNSTSANAYAVILAGLAGTATGGSNAQGVATSLSTTLNASTDTTTISAAITRLQRVLSTLASNNPTDAISTASTAVSNAIPAVPTSGTLSTIAATVSAAAQAASSLTPASVITIAQNAASTTAAGNTFNTGAAVYAAPMVANSKTLLTSLHNNFIMQASGVQADLNNITSPFQEAQNFALFLYQGANLASSGTLSKSITINNYPCKLTALTSGTATVVCQWAHNNGSAASTLHQLTITGPNIPSNLVPLGTYTWSDTLVDYLTLITAGTSSPSKTGVTPATGNVVGANLTGSPTYTLNGDIQPGEGITATHSLTTLTGLVVTETLNTSSNTLTSGMTGTIAEKLGTSTVDSVTLLANSQLVQNATDTTPISANLVLKASTQNYSFDGTIVMSNFKQDYSFYRTNTNLGWNPGTVAFTGSVSGISANLALGKFLTTTGAGLTVTSDRTKFDPTQALSALNYMTESGALLADITSGTTTNHLNLSFTSGTSATTYQTITSTLTYSDSANNNTVTLNETGTIAGTANVTIGLGTNNSGSAMYSSTTPTVASTPVGTVSASIVTFTDNTTMSLK